MRAVVIFSVVLGLLVVKAESIHRMHSLQEKQLLKGESCRFFAVRSLEILEGTPVLQHGRAES